MNLKMHLLTLCFVNAAILSCKSALPPPEVESKTPPTPAWKPYQQARHANKKAAPLPEIAKHLVRDRMLEHGLEMSNLLWATLFMDRKSAIEIADAILAVPDLANSSQPEHANSQLPQRFFKLQKDFRTRAEAYAKEVREERWTRVSAALGEVMSACVNCHVNYFTNPPRAGDFDQSEEYQWYP